MTDKYGYLKNPAEGTGQRKWLWLVGLGAAGGLIWWLLSRKTTSIGMLANKQKKREEVRVYPVTAPVDTLVYEGAGMPFDIESYEYAPAVHIEIDYNGVARLFTNDDNRAGGLISRGGNLFFVMEEELNRALNMTRQYNRDILYTITPFARIGPGYFGYCTSGTYIGQQVYITLLGQVGLTLNKSVGGELFFVPLDYIDETPDVWGEYLKPGGN